jgi:SET domain
MNDSDDLTRSLSNALGEEGILLSQVSEDDRPNSAGAHYSSKFAEFALAEQLKQQGFVRIEDYTEAHGGFMGAWKYKIAFKSFDAIERWHYNQAMIDLELHDRAMETIDGVQTPFRFFDGAAMMAYQYPSRINEEVFCRDTPTPELCEKGHGWNPERPNAHISTLEVKLSSIPNAGRGVFAKEDIHKGSYISLDEGVHNVLIMPSTVFWIEQFRTAGIVNRWKMFDAYMFGYGFVSDFFGASCYSVDGSILTFLNHGCNGSNNLSPVEPFFVTEMTADLKKLPDGLEYSPFEQAVYNPFARRNHLNFMHAGDVAGRDIKAGEELLDSYLSYYTIHEWERAVLSLRAQCLAQGKGSVSEYEQSSE